MFITGTFIDEISHDIPHQNWGPVEWEKDFLPFEVEFTGGYWATIKEVTDKKHIEQIFNTLHNC